MISPEEEESYLRSLEIAARERLGTIDDAKKTRRDFEEHSRKILLTIAAGHKEANRALVAAVDDAHSRGIRKSVIYKRIGLSSQRLSQIRRQVNRWNEEEETT